MSHIAAEPLLAGAASQDASPLGEAPLDVARLREEFPVLQRKVHGKALVYLDNAATSQTPQPVIDVFSDYYGRYNANIHRGLHTLADEATAAFEGTRKTVRGFFERTGCAPDYFHPWHHRSHQSGGQQLGAREPCSR